MELDHMSQCSQLKVVKETKNSVARGRWGSIIPFSSKIACILSDNNGEISHLINNITESGSSWSFSNMVPIELRIYNERGAGMEWHHDDVLFTPTPQIEVILTLRNTSDCVTKWKESDAVRREIETEDNSVIILKAGPDGPEHSVSALRNGSRSILKFAFAEDDSNFRQDAKKNTMQFVNTKNAKVL